MRRRMGIVVGACAALVLTGAVGVATFVDAPDGGRRVGTWHEAPGVRHTATMTGGGVPQGGRERVGAVRTAATLLGYGPGGRHQTFRHPGASYVKLRFDRLRLLPGDYVTVSGPGGGESHRYDALPRGRWAMSIAGDTAVLALHRVAAPPPGATAQLGVGVDRVAHGFTAAERAAAAQSADRGAEPVPPGRSGREESVCGSNQSVDAVCYRSLDPVVFTRSKAIARLLINGTELCTGWRIGARNRMVTNNHCFETSRDAYQTEVWFNYQCPRCGGGEPVRPTKVWGDKVLSTHRVYDYTLFTVEKFDQIRKYGHLSIDTRRPPRGEELYVPQHPAGQPAKIAGTRGERAGNCAVVDAAYDGYGRDTDVSYFCDTEGGSSGSPVLSRRTDKVIALHHFGGCPNSGVRADLVLSKIKKLI